MFTQKGDVYNLSDISSVGNFKSAAAEHFTGVKDDDSYKDGITMHSNHWMKCVTKGDVTKNKCAGFL